MFCSAYRTTVKKTILFVSFLAVLAIGGVSVAQDPQAIIGDVFLQDQTPGLSQLGHANISGTIRVGRAWATSTTVGASVIGNNTSNVSGALGAAFSSLANNGVACRGTAESATGAGIGVYGISNGDAGMGVQGRASGTTGVGVKAVSALAGGIGLWAQNQAGGLAAKFDGNTQANGNLVVQPPADGVGTFMVKYSNGNELLGVAAGGGGYMQLRAPNSLKTLYYGTAPVGMFVVGDAGTQLVKCYIDNSGVGTIEANVKNFVQPDPDNVNRDIVYASIEGPEAAAYVRGTARLKNGQAHVALPKHFTNVSLPDGMTVQVTPQSFESEGLAVVSRSLTGFDVRELRRGTGTYDFDWEVKAVRRGFGDYKVYRNWDRTLQPQENRETAMSGRIKSAKSVFGIQYTNRP